MNEALDLPASQAPHQPADDFIPRGRAWTFLKTEFIVEPEEFTYIQPTYRVSDELLARKSRYLVVSAPGAVGKTAFGLHLARTKNAMLWNLAKLRLGSNTFIGSVLQAVGPSNLPAFLASIASGETTLVFDAIDEAELHSGWIGVHDFLRDVISYTSNASPASVVLLARRDSAELLELALRVRTLDRLCSALVHADSCQSLPRCWTWQGPR